MKMLWQLITANVKDMMRDRMSMFWFLAFPIVFILLFGAVFSGNGADQSYSIGLAVEDKGPVGSGIRKAFESVPSFELHQGSKETELAALKQGKRILVVEVPGKVQATIATGKPAEISIYYDPGRAATAQALISAAREILSEVERRATGAPRLFIAKPIKVEVKQLKNIDYLLPGILAMALMQLGLFGALGFVSLRERKIIRRLGATPVPKSLVLWSEILVRLAMAVVQAVSIVLIGHLAYGVTVVGNWPAVLGLVLLGALVFISLGYFLISFTKTSESAQGLIQLVQFPMMFLSGIFFPIEIMPRFLKPVIRAIPLSYLGDALRNVMVGLPTAFGIWTDVAILGGWLLVTAILAVRLFRWE
ncbi:MAG: ABC transporter permease [Firmicutes bacterium]|nr:ABC transporter permease [Bacillota bacterium]